MSGFCKEMLFPYMFSRRLARTQCQMLGTLSDGVSEMLNLCLTHLNGRFVRLSNNKKLRSIEEQALDEVFAGVLLAVLHVRFVCKVSFISCLLS
jgi:hypothetical protein